MSIKQILFSDDNVDDVVDYILDQYDMEDDSRDPVENMLKSLMIPIYKKNQSKLGKVRDQGAIRKYVHKINEKAVKEFAKEYENYQSKDRGGGGSRGGDRRKAGSRGRGRGRGGGKDRGPQPMYSSGDDSGYAPVSAGSGGFIRADGTMGDSMFFGNLNEQAYQNQMGGMDGRGLSAKDQIEREMLLRQQEYEGMNPYATGMGYGMNPMMGNGNQRPPEINFCVDGGDTRGIANGDAGQGMMGMGGMTMGMDAMGMNNMGTANSMQNGMMGSLNGDGMSMSGMMGMNQNNPMMGMNGMNGMNPMMGMNNMGSGGGNDGGDFNSRLAQMEAERSGQGIEGMTNMNNMNMQNMQGNMQNMQDGSQNNPQMMQMMQMMQMINTLQQQLQNQNSNNSSNFRAGGRGGSSEIQNRIRDSKMEIAHRYDLDPELLASMSPEQIKELLEGGESESEYESVSESESDSESDDGMNLREKILAKFRDKKKKMEKENKKLGKEVSKVKRKIKKDLDSDVSDQSERSESEQSDSQQSDYSEDSRRSDTDSESEDRRRSSKRSRSKTQKKSRSKNDRSSNSKRDMRDRRSRNRRDRSEESEESEESHDSRSESESEDSRDRRRSERKSKMVVKKKTTRDRNSRTSVTPNVDDEDLQDMVVKIDSKTWTEPDFLSNYHVDLDDPIRNLRKIELEGRPDFPMMKPVIDESNNILCLVEQGDSIPIELESGDNMTLHDIIEEINSALEGADIPIEIIEDRDAHIVIRSTADEEFGLDFRGNSIAPCFGFTEEEYDGKTEYRSEDQHVFLSQPYYLFIEEVSDSPVCEISPEGDVKLLIKELNHADLKTRTKSTSKISGLTLNFRYDDDIRSDLVDFYEENHKIGFRFFYAEEDKRDAGRSGSRTRSNRRRR